MSDRPHYHWIDTPDRFAWAVDQIGASDRLALDLEGNSLHAYRDRICLLQISTPTMHFLIDTLVDLDLSPLAPILADPQVEKVFHACEQDIMALKRDYDLDVRGVFDTMLAARCLLLEVYGLVDLVGRSFDIQLDKKQQKSDWGERPLSPAQLSYAVQDTAWLLGLRDHLAEELDEEDKLGEAYEVFRSFEVVERVPEDPDLGFWRLKGVRDLSNRERAVLYALHMWREQEAARRDRPVFKVLNLDAMMRLAENQPTSPQTLAAMNCLSPWQVNRFGPALLSAIALGQSQQPPPLPPLPSFDRSLQDRYKSFQVWRKDTAQAHHIESDIILKNEKLKRLAAVYPIDIETAFAIANWGPIQRERYGHLLEEFLQRK